MPGAVGNTHRGPGPRQLIKSNVATANTSSGFTARTPMLSSAKKRLYLCLDSRKRFLTDPVFTKSRNNWFFTRSVYPPFPLQAEARAGPGASLPRAGVLGVGGRAPPPGAEGCWGLEARPPLWSGGGLAFLREQEKGLGRGESEQPSHLALPPSEARLPSLLRVDIRRRQEGAGGAAASGQLAGSPFSTPNDLPVPSFPLPAAASPRDGGGAEPLT